MTPLQRAILDRMAAGAVLWRTYGTLTGEHFYIDEDGIASAATGTPDHLRAATVRSMQKGGWIVGTDYKRTGIGQGRTHYVLTDKGRGALAGAPPAVEAANIVREGGR